MKIPTGRRWRPLFLVIALSTITACASDSGCNGCSSGQPIPGGFPQAHRFDNAGQIRLTSSGVTYLEQNLEKLMLSFLPSGLTFTIPPSGCSSTTKVCCGSNPCTASIDITKVDITPKSGARLNLKLDAKVTTNKLYFAYDLPWPLGWLNCDAQYDTTAKSPSTAGLSADIDLVIDANNHNKLKIERKTMTITNFDCGDIDISGGFDCTIASWLCGLFKSKLLDGVQGPMEQAIDDLIKTLPTGIEARYDLAALLAAFDPSASGLLDYFVWGGGYAQTENGGVSAGAMGGFRAAEHNPCVPNCEVAGASCTPPPKAAITRSNIFRDNTRPDGKSFHVGIGVHRQTLDQAAYALYSSGALCLDVSSNLSTQLNSGLFSLLVPSLNVLTGGEQVPVLLAVRPQKPPTVTLGDGTWHTDKDGNPVIDEPLIKVAAKDFKADVYALIEQRWVRLFTVKGNLYVPALVYANGQGNLQVMLGDLSKALSNVSIANSELLAEDPAKLAKLFPTVLNVAAGMFSTSFDPIALPDFAGIKLGLDTGSITSVDNKDVLAVFANLELTQSTSASGDLIPGARDSQRVDARAHVVKLEVPPTAAFAVTHPDFSPDRSPAVLLELDAVVPPSLTPIGRRGIEWSVRVDGGFWRPWTKAKRMLLRDPLFWIQGEHQVEIQARLAGQHRTTDLSPAQLKITIDTVEPKLRLIRNAEGLRAEVKDLVTPSGELALRWIVDGRRVEGKLVDGVATLQVPADAKVRVEVEDKAGNIAQTTETRVADIQLPSTEEAGGCAVARSDAPTSSTSAYLLLLGLALLSWRRRRDS
ncbi:MAG: hypothetical protein CSA65_02615 [Proteobacteria bacterium]|nr:MAG: hypothetical protein CSB49_04150 [Pseudomonadota bacterium]PIE19392.1 MAG: hypothetical protein CSA65_02615 [Pseudomonadota bacterium]